MWNLSFSICVELISRPCYILCLLIILRLIAQNSLFFSDPAYQITPLILYWILIKWLIVNICFKSQLTLCHDDDMMLMVMIMVQGLETIASI
jgi:hypothetical protein